MGRVGGWKSGAGGGVSRYEQERVQQGWWRRTKVASTLFVRWAWRLHLPARFPLSWPLTHLLLPCRYVFDSAEAAEAAASSERYIVAKSEAEARDKAVQQYGPGAVLKQETDVLDTWFSSGLWPFSTLGWPAATPEMER